MDLGRWFSPADLDAWRALATKTLGGRDADVLDREVAGVLLRALETDRPDGSLALGRPGPWQIRVEVAGPAPKAAARHLAADLSRGADAPWIRLDRASRLGVRPDEAREEGRPTGLSLITAADLAGLVKKVDLASTPVVIEAGANGLAVLGALIAVAHRRDVPAAALTGAIHGDPLSALARDGHLPRGVDAAYDDLAACVTYARETSPGLRTLAVSGLPAAEAGADAPTELAVILAALAETLRRLEARELDAATVLPQIEVTVGLGRDLLVETAKLRALRRLWARLTAACGVPADRPFVHARQLDAHLATVDPWTNLLRSTQAGFVGAVGGADALTLRPHDAALGPPRSHGRRVVRNLHLLLRDESHLARVEDPAAGSFTLEHLTDRLCRQAWEALQGIEQGGGLLQALADGSLAERIAGTAASTARAVARRSARIVGVSAFADATQDLPAPEPFDAVTHDLKLRSRWEAATLALGRVEGDRDLSLALDALRSGAVDRVPHAANAAFRGVHLATIAGAVPGMAFTARPLEPVRLAAPWEALRRRVQGADPRPTVFLVNLGPIPDHKAREDFARDLLGAGGFEVLTNDGFDDPDEAAVAYGTSGATGVCICGSDDAYERLVPTLAPRLKAAGAAFVVVAGRPPDPGAWDEAGVTHVVHLGADVLAVLTDLADLVEAR